MWNGENIRQGANDKWWSDKNKVIFHRFFFYPLSVCAFFFIVSVKKFIAYMQYTEIHDLVFSSCILRVHKRLWFQAIIAFLWWTCTGSDSNAIVYDTVICGAHAHLMVCYWLTPIGYGIFVADWEDFFYGLPETDD